ncbi:uncharacterized protein DS421_4g118940 [Arachis hypogaea]|nr:uncharacterized protein DS421_4g118940 [Arachis hypogaea]
MLEHRIGTNRSQIPPFPKTNDATQERRGTPGESEIQNQHPEFRGSTLERDRRDTLKETEERQRWREPYRSTILLLYLAESSAKTPICLFGNAMRPPPAIVCTTSR